MRRVAAALTLGVGALLLTPGAPGVPVVPGDPTPPVVTPVITGTLGNVGWYTSNVTVNWSIADPESIILSTSGCDARTFTANTPGTVLTCTAESDGGTSSISKNFKVDKTAPIGTATPSRAADADGWYNHELSVDFTGNDSTSGLASCSPTQTYAGPDNAAATVAGSCRDVAGNTAPVSLPLKYDETSPSASATARAPDANGWFNNAVTVTFQGADTTSGVATCTQTTYAGPDDASVALSGTCVDRAGNQSSSSVFVLAYDETAPVATASASRIPDQNGWYRSPLTVTFAGTDATSGLASCDAPKTYAGPDVVTTSVAGTCRDRAGNQGSPGVTVKYDSTAPQVATSPARAANAQGWYNAPLGVTFAGTDPTSGVASCDAAKSYAGPDSALAVVTGGCRDNAGNSGSGSLALKYDATAPQATATPTRQPNANGWYNAALSVGFGGTDATAGIDTCDADKSYTGPDNAAASLSGTCRDRAGNQSAPSAFGFRYDATAPVVTTSAGRAANANGWYTAPLAVSFAGTDATSGVDSCDAAKTYSGPDSATASVSGTCRDKAGNPGSGSHALRYDATAPQTTATPSPQANALGWHNAPLTVSFAGSDATAGIEACDAAKSYAGPDSAGATVAGVCRDRAGNTATGSLLVRYDATVPVTNAVPARQPNANSWYNAPLSVSFAGSDVTAGIDSCDAAKSYTGPDTSTAALSGTCRDRAGNSSGTTFALRYDATAPTVTAAPDSPANANGWHNRPLSVRFTGGDAASGLEACDAPMSYSGPDRSSVSIGGGCRDKAGNVGTGSVAIRYDATGPATIATPSRQPNAGGWYNAPLTVSFAATDSVSGVASCPAQQSYGGPDTASGVVSGTCLDNAGNGGLGSLAIKYDATAPQATPSPVRAPNGNGWYNAPLSVAFQGSDLTSGVDSCTAPLSYTGPDTSATSLSGSCRDRAGNSSTSAVFGLKYDATAPVVTQGVPVREPDRGGWYNRPVAFAVQGIDALSGLDSCPATSYSGPDSADATFTGACLDKAGNVGTKAVSLRYDGTGPQVTASPSRGPDSNGWYNQPLAVSFSGSDAVSGLESCAPPESYSGPDSGAAVVGGICLDAAGNVGVSSLEVSYDVTPPQLTGASANRIPDRSGWYNRPLVVSFHGSDVTSKVEVCTEARYAGPDAAAASIRGACVDYAGNASAVGSFALRYDGTPPSLTGVTVKPGNGTAVISWKASADTVVVELRRAGRIVYSGTGQSFKDTRLQNGLRHRYTVAAYDEAGNAATASVVATPTAPLVSPTAGAKVWAPPLLVWKAVRNASYYNVQLWRRGKIFSAWPKGTSLRLSRTWTYQGRRYRLTPGRYRWFVWPGYGRRAQKKFGPPLGSSTFVVR